MTIAVLFLSGCSKENDYPIEDGPSNYVKFNTGILTKSPTATAFTTGDNITVYHWSGDNGSTVITSGTTKKDYSFDGNNWDVTEASAPAISWPDLTTNYYFMGVYPTPDHDIPDFTADPYTLDISNEEKSDLLIATNTGGINGSTTDPVSLTFTHAMAELTINLHYASEIIPAPTINNVTVKVYAKSAATVNYLTKTVTPTDLAADDIDIPTVANCTVTYKDLLYVATTSSIMVPQTIGNITITITDASDVQTNYTYSATNDLLTAGKNNIFYLKIGKDGTVKLDNDKISINDWESGTENGTAIEATVD